MHLNERNAHNVKRQYGVHFVQCTCPSEKRSNLGGQELELVTNVHSDPSTMSRQSSLS